jgi:hypothetical protein
MICYRNRQLLVRQRTMLSINAIVAAISGQRLKCDRDRSGLIDLGELYSGVKAQVVAETNGEQTPCPKGACRARADQWRPDHQEPISGLPSGSGAALASARPQGA